VLIIVDESMNFFAVAIITYHRLIAGKIEDVVADFGP